MTSNFVKSKACGDVAIRDQESGDRNQIKPPQNHRHCEERGDVAFPTAVPFSGRTKQTERPSGLPRACGPRNDEFNGACIDFASPLARQVLKNAEQVLKNTERIL
jgi:hypothetical protein